MIGRGQGPRGGAVVGCGGDGGDGEGSGIGNGGGAGSRCVWVDGNGR